MIEKESKLKRDIIRIPLIESYEELPYKILQSFAFVNKLNFNFDFIMKIDDDIFFNSFELMDFVDSIREEDVFVGQIYSNGRPDRNRKSKYFVAEELFPNNAYKPFTYGGCYIIKRKIINYLIDSHHYAKFIPMEDVYISSLVILSGFYISRYENFFICYDLSYCQYSLIVWIGTDITSRMDFVKNNDQYYSQKMVLNMKYILFNSNNNSSNYTKQNISNKINKFVNMTSNSTMFTLQKNGTFNSSSILIPKMNKISNKTIHSLGLNITKINLQVNISVNKNITNSTISSKNFNVTKVKNESAFTT